VSTTAYTALSNKLILGLITVVSNVATVVTTYSQVGEIRTGHIMPSQHPDGSSYSTINIWTGESTKRKMATFTNDHFNIINNNGRIQLGASQEFALFFTGSQANILNTSGAMEFDTPTNFVFDFGGIFYLRDKDNADQVILSVSPIEANLNLTGTGLIFNNQLAGADPSLKSSHASLQELALTGNLLISGSLESLNLSIENISTGANPILTSNSGLKTLLISDNLEVTETITFGNDLITASSASRMALGTAIAPPTGFDFRPSIASSGAIAMLVAPTVTQATASTFKGIAVQSKFDGTTLTDRYGIMIYDETGSGIVTNNYGLYINLLVGGTTLNYAIYSVNGGVFLGGLATSAGNGFLASTTAGLLSYRTNAQVLSDLGITTEIVEDTTPQLGGNLDLNEKGIELNATALSDHIGTGMIISYSTYGSGVTLGDAVSFGASDTVGRAVASTSSGAPAVGIALETKSSAPCKILTYGYIRDDSWNWTGFLGDAGLIYLSTTGTAGNTLTQTPPSLSGEVVQVIGYAVTADTMFVSPSLVLVEIV